MKKNQAINAVHQEVRLAMTGNANRRIAPQTTGQFEQNLAV
jgi:hypothetical protein